MNNVFYAVVFLAPDAQYLKKITIHDLPNPDPGGVAQVILDETPHAMSIILIDHNFRVVNQYRSPELA